jgi:hypothetical protein
VVQTKRGGIHDDRGAASFGVLGLEYCHQAATPREVVAGPGFRRASFALVHAATIRASFVMWIVIKALNTRRIVRPRRGRRIGHRVRGSDQAWAVLFDGGRVSAANAGTLRSVSFANSAIGAM